MIDLSSYAKTLNGRPIAVFGLGVSGIATLKALISAGISVTAWDDREENQQKAIDLGANVADLSVIDLIDYEFLVLAPGVPYSFEPHPVVINAQKSSLEVICDIELFHRSGNHTKTIGITGTNGKSTTTALMTHVLKSAGLNTVMAGNIGVAIFDLENVSDLDVLVLEMSSYQLDLCPSFRPDISIVLNITPDHLDRHGSMQAYIDAKAIILEGIGTAVIGVDDDYTQVLFDQSFLAQTRKVIPVSVKSSIVEGYFVRQGNLYCNNHGEDILIHDFQEANYLNLRGLHNQQNASFVYVVSKELGLTDQSIFDAFTSYSGLEHRQYLVAKKGNISYINDSKATNAEAAAKALSSFNNIYWIVGGQAKEGGLEGLEIFKKNIVKTYVIGEAKTEFSAWLQYHGFAHEISDVLSIAINKANEDALSSNNECIILLSPACASWDQFTSFANRGDVFTDQVRELIGM